MTDNNTNLPEPTNARRRTPRRNGKGSNAAANAHLEQQVILPTGDDAAEKEGGVKLLGNRRIIPFMKIRIPMVILSLLITIASIVALATQGLNLGLDFTGGVSADVRFSQSIEQTQVVSALADSSYPDAVVQYLVTNQELLIRLPPPRG